MFFIRHFFSYAPFLSLGSMTLRDILPPKGQESPRRRSIPCPLRGTRSKAESREAQGGLAEAEKGASQRETQNREQCFRLFIFAVFAKAFRLKGEGFRPGEWKNIKELFHCPLSRHGDSYGRQGLNVDISLNREAWEPPLISVSLTLTRATRYSFSSSL